jgi:uncharacterized membrane protein
VLVAVVLESSPPVVAVLEPPAVDDVVADVVAAVETVVELAVVVEVELVGLASSSAELPLVEHPFAAANASPMRPTRAKVEGYRMAQEYGIGGGVRAVSPPRTCAAPCVVSAPSMRSRVVLDVVDDGGARRSAFCRGAKPSRGHW